MDFVKYSAKTVNDAITQAALALGVSSEQLEIEVIDEGSNGFLGIGSRPAVIQAKKKFSLEGTAVDFLKDEFRTMNMEVEIDVVYDDR